MFGCWQMFALHVYLETDALFRNSGAIALETTAWNQSMSLPDNTHKDA